MGSIAHSNVFVYYYWKWEITRTMVKFDGEYKHIPTFTTSVGEGISTSDKTLRREITKLSEHMNKLIELYEKRISYLENKLNDR